MNSPLRPPERRSIRWADYDYRLSGLYFVTICAHERRCLFGDVVGDSVRPSPAGEVVIAEWVRSGEIRREIAIDAFVVMPNHLHGIVAIDQSVHPAVSAPSPRSRSLGSFINGFKAATTRHINDMRGTVGAAVWQRNYYERVIRNEDELNRIREYIAVNPAKWTADRENPAAILSSDPKASWEV